MDNVPTSRQPPPQVARTISVEGCFGSVTWKVSNELYGFLPVRSGKGWTRDTVLDVAGSKKLTPFFTQTCERLLVHVDRRDVKASSLNPEWSLQTLTVECTFGEVFWSIGQGIWDTLPADQRESLLELTKELVHVFFHQEIADPLVAFAMREFRS